MPLDQSDWRSHRNKSTGTFKMTTIVARPNHPHVRAQESPLYGFIGVNSSRTSSSLEIPSRPKGLLAGCNEKPLPEVPKAPIDDTSNYAANSLDRIHSPNPNLFPDKLNVKKKRQPIDIVRRIEELTQHNGHLSAELAVLRESRVALKELRHKTQEACRILEAAMTVASHKARFSEQLLIDYWGTHLGDGSEEIRVF